MAYGDYLDAATLLDTCDAYTGDTPGKNVGCRFVGQTEGASSATANRPHLALAENMDNLKLPLDSQLAVTQVGQLLSFSKTTIDIDMINGAGSDINFSPSGYLYVGNGTYSALPLQEALDTLFQFVDEDYNEVMVDGEEVKVTAISVGPAVGSGFYNTAVVTLQLGTDSGPLTALPSGNYRLSYAREATLATLPDDALIRADIRGIHEGAGESAKPSWVVCAVSGIADYVGASALEDAISDGHERIYLKQGTYGPYNSLSLNAQHIIGEDKNTTVVEVNADAANGLISTSNGCSIEDLTITAPGAITSTSARIQLSQRSYLRNVSAIGWRLELDTRTSVENVECGGPSGCILVGQNENTVHVRNVKYDAQHMTTGDVMFIGSGCADMVFENIRPFTPGSGISVGVGIDFAGVTASQRLRFTNCYIEVGDVTCLLINQPLQGVKFENCEFRGNRRVADTDFPVEQHGLIFENCRFINTASAWYGLFFVELQAMHEPEGVSVTERGIILNNCYFYDKWSKGTDDASDPGATPTGGGTLFPVMKLDGVAGRNVVFDRGDCSHIVMDESWVYMSTCNIDGFAVHHQDSPDGAQPFSYGALAGGLVEVDFQSKITELSVQLDTHYDLSGTPVALQYTGGIIYIRGGSYVSDSVYLIDGRTVVEGVSVRFDGDALLSSTCGAICVDRQATVRGYTFGRGNNLYKLASGSKALVFLQGKDVVFEDFNIYCDATGDTHDIESMIRIRGNATESIRIRKGRIYMRPQTGFRPYHAIYAEDDTMDDILVDSVTAIFGDDIQSAGQAIFDFDQTGVSLVKVVNCLIRVLGNGLDSGSGVYDAIKFNSGVIGGGVGNSAKAIGNDVILDGGVSPEITPNTVVGYALNNLTTAGTPPMAS